MALGEDGIGAEPQQWGGASTHSGGVVVGSKVFIENTEREKRISRWRPEFPLWALWAPSTLRSCFLIR